MNYVFKSLVGIFFLSIVTLSGCTKQAEIAHEPEDNKSPLSTIQSMKIYLKIEDLRDLQERERVGVNKLKTGMNVGSVKLNQKVITICYDALKNEFINNGHQILDGTDSNPDVVIKIGLKKFWGEAWARDYGLEVIGTINAEIAVIDPQNDAELFSKPITATVTRKEFTMVYGRAVERVLNETLVEFIRNFSRDPGILKALSNAKK